MKVAQKQPAGERGARFAGTTTRLPAGLTLSTIAWLTVGSLTLIGIVLRLIVADQALFADELATYWVVTDHRLFEMFSVIHGNAEISPPLFFLLSWLTAHVSHAEEYIRAPSLVAGVATIPLVYLLGLRTVGRTAALVATALTAFSPFMIYYSAEARAYAVMMLFVVISTLALLYALDRGGAGWWVVYALSSCLAVYSHYTCAFLLAVQLAWVLLTQPAARRPAILANLGALVLFLPWATGVRNDFRSPTADILSVLSPFTTDTVTANLLHWAVGHPYPYVPLDDLPGRLALALAGAGVALAIAGWVFALARRTRPPRGDGWREPRRRTVLVVALALSVPLGTMLASAVGDNILSVRNMAASWPAFALSMASLLNAAGPRLRYAAIGLTVTAVGFAGLTMLDEDYVRPDHHASAKFVESRIAPGDFVIDATAFMSPGPLSTLDTTLAPGIPILRAGAPAEREHPFTFWDPIVSTEEAFFEASKAAPARVFFVSTGAPDTPGYAARKRALSDTGSRSGYQLLSTRTFPGFVKAQVDVFKRADGSPPEER